VCVCVCSVSCINTWVVVAPWKAVCERECAIDWELWCQPQFLTQNMRAYGRAEVRPWTRWYPPALRTDRSDTWFPEQSPHRCPTRIDKKVTRNPGCLERQRERERMCVRVCVCVCERGNALGMIKHSASNKQSSIHQKKKKSTPKSTYPRYHRKEAVRKSQSPKTRSKIIPPCTDMNFDRYSFNFWKISCSDHLYSPWGKMNPNLLHFQSSLFCLWKINSSLFALWIIMVSPGKITSTVACHTQNREVRKKSSKSSQKM